MNKTLLKTISLAVTAVLLITAVFATSVFAALFSSSVPIGSDVLFHQIDSQQLTASFDFLPENLDLSFKHAGDKKEIKLVLENNSSDYFHYFYGVSLIETEQSGLESVVLVYFDDEYLGTLAYLTQSGEFKIDSDYYILKEEKQEHKLTFELHMAAQGSNFENKKCKVNILSYAQTHDVNKVIFVNSAQELFHALNDVSAYTGNINKKIILTSNITLTKHLEVTKPCTIDLRGFDIDFGDYNINLLHEGVLTVKSSKSLSNNASGSGRFHLNNPLGVVNFEDSASFYALNYFNIEEKEGQLQYDKALAKQLLTDRFESRLANLKLNDLQSFSPFGALYCYVSKGDITITPSSQYGFDTTTGVLTPISSMQNSINAVISIEGQDFIFKIVGKNESALQELLEQYLQHIPNVTVNEGVEILPSVTYDLFLPLRIDALNASLSWHSSNVNLITDSGKIGKTAQGEVSLTAEIRINEELYQHTFSFYVVRQNNEMRFMYLLALLNPITLSEVYPAEGSLYALPVVDEGSDYHYTSITNGKELGLVGLSYEVDPSYYYLGLSDIDSDGYTNEIYIKEPTFQVYAQVTVTGYFGAGEYYEGNISIKIELGENAELQDAVFRHVESCLSAVDVLQNIIDTRVLYGMQYEKGDFLLPLSYNGFNIEYSIPTVANRMQNIVDRYKAQDEGYLALMAWAQGGAQKSASLVVSAGLSTELGEIISDGTPAITEEERAVLKGYDHDTLYTQIISWATGSYYSAASTVWTEAPSQQATLTADGLSTISGGEGEVILMYTLSKSYSGFSAQWQKYFNTEAGVNEKSGDYYFDLTGGIITSITQNESGKAVISLNALNFNTTDTSVPLDVKVYMSSIATGEESREMYFTVPSVIKKDVSGFSEEGVYNAVKLQVWQQLPQNEQIGLNDAISDGEIQIIQVKLWNSWNYILVRDIKLTSSLVFQNGSPEQQFIALLGWATSPTVQEVQSVVSYFVGHALAHNTSDGNVFITTAEYQAIEAFFNEHGGNLSSVWSGVTTQAYNLTPEGKSILLNSSSGGVDPFLGTLTNLAYSTDTFVGYMEWARSTSYYKPSLLGSERYGLMNDNYFETAKLASNSGTAQNDRKAYISSTEANLLFIAFKSLGRTGSTSGGFNEFEGAWNAAMESLGLSYGDTGFYIFAADPNLAVITSESQMTTNLNSGGSNYRKGYIYTGTTTSSYTQNHLYVLKREYKNPIIGAGTATYSYEDAGEVVLEGGSYKGNFSTDALFQTAIVNAMKDIIGNRYNTLLTWATGTGTPTTATEKAGIDYLSAGVGGQAGPRDYFSDGKATVSMKEKAVIIDFWNKVLPTPNAAFGNLWNSIGESDPNKIPLVPVFTDTGNSELNEFYQENQEVSENLPLLNLAENDRTNNNSPLGATIPRGMKAILDNADKTQAGSIYQYTGESETSNGVTYTKWQYYRLNYNSDTHQYSFIEISVPLCASPQDLLNILQSADANEIGKTYLYTGENNENFTFGLAYQIRYDERSGEYYFKALRIENVNTVLSHRELYYPYIVDLDRPDGGMNFFTNLKELYLFGAPSDLTPIFTSLNNAKSFFSKVTTYSVKLEKLVMQYASLGDISSIGVFKELNFLDLLGNGILSKIGALSNLKVKDLAYLDLHKTGVNYGYNLAIFANIYYSYQGAHGSYPQIYYTLSGERTLFTTGLSPAEIEILEYLFYLKEIGVSSSKYTLLPNTVYTSSQSYPIKWYELIDGTEHELPTLSPSGAYRYTNAQIGTGTPSSTVLRAKITVDDGITYYYRDFEVDLAG